MPTPAVRATVELGGNTRLGVALIEEFHVDVTKNKRTTGGIRPRQDAGAGTAVVRPTLKLWLAAVARPPASLLALLVTFVIFTLLAAGPLQGLDRALNQPWSKLFVPVLADFVQERLDPVAGQAIAVPVLGLVAVILSWRCRSWRPLLVAGGAELVVSGLVGVLKLGLARPSPILGDPVFFHGGLLADGWHGTSFPSGHAAQAVALYGIAVYLISRFGKARKQTVRWLAVGVGLITAMTMLSSLYLGWHWATDLGGGVITGAIALRTAAWLDHVLVIVHAPGTKNLPQIAPARSITVGAGSGAVTGSAPKEPVAKTLPVGPVPVAALQAKPARTAVPPGWDRPITWTGPITLLSAAAASSRPAALSRPAVPSASPAASFAQSVRLPSAAQVREHRGETTATSDWTAAHGAVHTGDLTHAVPRSSRSAESEEKLHNVP